MNWIQSLFKKPDIPSRAEEFIRTKMPGNFSNKDLVLMFANHLSRHKIPNAITKDKDGSLYVRSYTDGKEREHLRAILPNVTLEKLSDPEYFNAWRKSTFPAYWNCTDLATLAQSYFRRQGFQTLWRERNTKMPWNHAFIWLRKDKKSWEILND